MRRYVALESPPNTAAWVYVLNEPAARGELAGSDDWLDVYERKRAAPR